MDISAWIERHAAYAPAKTAIAFAGREIAYAEFAAEIEQLAAALAHELGIGRGARIAILAYNRPEYLALLFACARLGAILVPLNWRLAPPEHAYILDNAGVAAVFCDAEFRAGLESIGGVLGDAHRIGFGFSGSGWRDYGALVEAAAGRDASRVGGPDDPILIVYTSGTTGHPKGAVLTQSALLWNAINSTAMHDLVSTDRVLTFLPMFHVGGLNIQTLPALHAGATVLLQPRFVPAEALAAIAQQRPTVTLLVPAVMKAMIEHPDWSRTDLSSLRIAGAGSSIVPIELIRAFHARGVPICQIYGSTETGPTAIVLRREDAMRKEGSTGTPALHCEIRIVDDQGRDVSRGQRGEILVRGGNVMTGYWRDPEATAAALKDGWFHTGDIGHQDEEGFYWIDERKKDMIISGGENIYPAELETVLAACPDIAEAAVVARPDPKWGEVPVAVVVPRPGASIDAAAVKALFVGRLAKFKHPHDVVFVDSLPRNVMSKVLRYKLRELVAGVQKPTA